MTDGVIKGTGNSRYLKSVSNFKTLYPTYDDFVAALVAGTLPVDLLGLNSGGWNQLPTVLNKANLLSDTTANLYGYDSSAVPNQIFENIKKYINKLPESAKITALEAGTVTSYSAYLTLTASYPPDFAIAIPTKIATYCHALISTAATCIQFYKSNNDYFFNIFASTVNGNTITFGNTKDSFSELFSYKYILLSRKD